MPPLTAGFGRRSPLHIGIFQSAGFAHLDRWVRYNIPPPPGALVNFNNNAPVLDQFGNSTGGVRSPYLDVPTVQWFAGSPGPGLAFVIGYFRPFDAQHLRPVYASHEDYVGRVVDDARKLVAQRYILREDGDEIIRHAQKSDVPTLADIPSDIPEILRGPSEEGKRVGFSVPDHDGECFMQVQAAPGVSVEPQEEFWPQKNAKDAKITCLSC
jgi:hypothetical protein